VLAILVVLTIMFLAAHFVGTQAAEGCQICWSRSRLLAFIYVSGAAGAALSACCG
jgi:hypothetical protein